MNRAYVLAGLLSFVLFSCSKSSPSLQASGPLNASQRSILEAELDSAGNIFGAINLSKRESVGLYLFDTSTDANQTVQKKMADALKAGECAIPIKNDKNPAATGSGDLVIGKLEKNFYMTVSGDNCPVELSISVEGNPSAYESKGKMEYGFQVKNVDFAKLNDVVGASFKAEGNATLKMNGTEKLYEGQVYGSGNFQSQQYGNVKMEFVGNANVKKAELYKPYGLITVAVLFGFPDFTVELKNVLTYNGSDNPSETCTLNGESISRSTFYRLIEKAGGDIHNWPLFFKHPANIE